MIDVTDEMRRAAYRAGRQWAAEHGHPQPDDRMLDAVTAAVLAIVERDQQPAARKGYETAIAVLRGVAERSGSPAFIFCADYLLADPDRLAPPPQ